LARATPSRRWALEVPKYVLFGDEFSEAARDTREESPFHAADPGNGWPSVWLKLNM